MQNVRANGDALPVSWSEVTAAVKPTPEEPRPVVDMAKGAIFIMALRSWDLATEGSPTIIIFMSLKETINQFINIQHSILMLGPQGMVLDTGNKRIA